MTEKPHWLPAMLDLTDKAKEESLPILYEVFTRDLKKNRPSFHGLPVWWNRRVLPGQRYEEGFWHLISKEGQDTVNRRLDLPRAERLPWCKPTITYPDENPVKVWDYLERRHRLRTYVWLENWDYCIVLERRDQSGNQVAWLITAFHVDGPSRRRNLRRKFDRRAD